ncbi:MATE family efflux transporter [Sphingomonas lutea]|uniref:MATE family efflux transporter n=1 Tax=Sphingomonas lutea TaxID=1045317 RepID=A0A7G9SHF2_9SPHN|nr:MATE family efflux transporter [Sphingomonas lutea]QNN67277.1 MATE family efflux transporter [Sphingomonas lutea]
MEQPVIKPRVRPPVWSEELRATLTLAWPLILSNLTFALIQATDVVLMGWLGPQQLAASALGINLTWPLGFAAFGILTAASPMMATALGAKAHSVRDVRRSFRQSMWLAVMAALPLWLMLWHAETIILALGQQPDLARDAAIFLRGYMWTMLPWLLFQAMRNFLAAVERPGWVLAISAVGIFANALLGWALIFGRFGLPAMGIFGGGLASSIVWTGIALALAAVILTDRQFRRFHLFGHFWRPDWPRLGRMLRLGIPIGFAFAFEGAVFGAAAYLMGLIDAASVAAHAVALQIAALTFMVPWGLSQAATVRVGRALGAGDVDGLGRAGWIAWSLGVLFMAAMAAVMWAVPRDLVGFFLDDTPANARVIDLAVTFLVVAAAFQIFDGAQVVGAGMLRGLHDTRMPMLFALLGYWVIGIGAGAWLAFERGWDGVGIWTGLAIGLGIVSALMLGRWALRERFELVRTRGAG